jgi:hypothetical protein
VPEKHYMLPVLERQPNVEELIEGEFYFVLHAPRQSGKTTFLDVLTDKINSEGKKYALNVSLASLRSFSDITTGLSEVIGQLDQAMFSSQVEIIKQKADTNNFLSGKVTLTRMVRMFLNQLSENLDKDLVIFFDEADCLQEAPLIPFLSQIRDGYNIRHKKGNKFPSSMALVGMRDIRDYLTQVRADELSKGVASPFNIKKEALTLSNFTQKDIGTLYRQHTEATGQVFEEPAIVKAWYWSEGQPWLVNALADTVIAKQLHNDFSVAITGDHIDQAAEILIQRRDTHIDSLLERLKETRVIRVMDAVFASTKGKVPIRSDDRQYCIDLGLVVKNDDESLRPSNNIYKEVSSRVITDEIQYSLDINIDQKTWTDGKFLLMSHLLKQFQNFWRHNSLSFPSKFKDFAAFKYDEATYAFMLLAYLQKIVNSGGIVHPQYAEGRGAVDIAILYNGREYLIECKLNEDYFSLADSLKQIAGYLDTAGEKEGWLVVFDRDLNKTWDQKIFWETHEYNGKTIHYVGC